MIHSSLDSARRVGLALVALAMAVTGLVFVAAPAEAHAPDAAYTHDVFVVPGFDCPAGYVENGKVTTLGTGCRPAGYVPVTDVAECNGLPFGGWDADSNSCVIDFNRGCDRPDATAVSSSGNCHRIWLKPAAGSGAIAPAAPACIESDLLQGNSAYANLRVGDNFYVEGDLYVVTTGLPACGFGCASGFDINCDGRLGDYCRVELDRTKVADVGTCLAERVTATNLPQ